MIDSKAKEATKGITKLQKSAQNVNFLSKEAAKDKDTVSIVIQKKEKGGRDEGKGAVAGLPQGRKEHSQVCPQNELMFTLCFFSIL